MCTSRREFLRMSAAAASLAALGCHARRTRDSNPESESMPPSKKLLILGGTGFLGPAIVEAALARGHQLTLFNRGKTRPDLFPDIVKLRGDRDPTKGDGIRALAGRQWDVVFDDCGYYPRMVTASAELLAPNVKQYVFVSSISAYADNKKVGADERAPLATIADPTVEVMGANYENYGALKALCEQAAERAAPGRVTVVRPGFIVGPGDPTDRFTYWPVRVDRGGEVLAPGEASDPIQIIDVRDLARWMVRVAEDGLTGAFNACGPGEKLTMGALLGECRAATSSSARLTWVKAEFLEKQGEAGDAGLPIWISPAGDYLGFHTWSAERAIRAGLGFRPIDETVKDTLAWWKTLPAERQAKLRAGLSPEREAAILAAWHRES